MYKLQKEVDEFLRQCNTDSERSMCRVFIGKDLKKLGYELSIYDKVIEIMKGV